MFIIQQSFIMFRDINSLQIWTELVWLVVNINTDNYFILFQINISALSFWSVVCCIYDVFNMALFSISKSTYNAAWTITETVTLFIPKRNTSWDKERGEKENRSKSQHFPPSLRQSVFLSGLSFPSTTSHPPFADFFFLLVRLSVWAFALTCIKSLNFKM